MYVLTLTSEDTLHEREGKKIRGKTNQPQITIASGDAAASVQLKLHNGKGGAIYPLHRASFPVSFYL
jgi:hypothetical protein